ncbi:hypothetical protein Taro_009187 [Colocasia esculenta]|uniref:Uncharacterized protein n=1 Tax=Colocasia esculenta TaxID=4460 RepID=A0A843TVP7_COLES|nr:hypothetical protein [Colocasia esculenta]
MDGGCGWGSIEEAWRKGPWTAKEDKLLVEHVRLHGEGRWNCVSMLSGLRRSGKSCRLRWVNYLRPDLKKEKITPHEESIIIELQSRWGNRWSAIARCLPGRTDNEIKNYWRTHFKKTKPGTHLRGARGDARLQSQQQYQLQQQQQPQEPPAYREYPAETGRSTLPAQFEEQVASLAQDHMSMEDLSFLYPTPDELQSDASFTDEASGDEGSWSCLWNLGGDEHAAAVMPTAFGTNTSLQEQLHLLYMLGSK